MLFDKVKILLLRPSAYHRAMAWFRWKAQSPATGFRVQHLELEIDATRHDYWHLHDRPAHTHWIVRTPLGLQERSAMRCYLGKLYREDPERCVRVVRDLGGEMHLLKVSEPEVFSLLPKDRDRIYFTSNVGECGREVLDVRFFKRAATAN